MNIGVLLSGGIGSRFGSEEPKQYLELNHRKVIEYSLDAFRKSKGLDRYFVVVAPEHCKQCPFPLEAGVALVPGGSTRNGSIKAALDHIVKTAPDCEKIVIHEAARPFLTASIVDDYLAILDEYDAIIATKKITDGLASVHQWMVKREDYFLLQAPEGFRFSRLLQCFDGNSPMAAAIQQMPPESKLFRYENFPNNVKITYPEDLIVAASLMNQRQDTC